MALINAHADVFSGARSNFWFESLFTSMFCVCKQPRLWHQFVHHRNFLKNTFSGDKIIKCYQALQKVSNSFETNQNVMC